MAGDVSTPLAPNRRIRVAYRPILRIASSYRPIAAAGRGETGLRDDVKDGMRIIWDAPIATSDGNILRADVFHPVEGNAVPAILSYGPYAKGMSFAESRPFAWQRLVDAHPAAMAATSNKYQAWELPDPENWVRDGYAVVRVDARGAGRSPDSWIPGLRAKRRTSTSASPG